MELSIVRHRSHFRSISCDFKNEESLRTMLGIAIIEAWMFYELFRFGKLIKNRNQNNTSGL